MKTRKEINELKDKWLKDPCWNIENTDGFEDHHDELLLFRLQIDNEDMRKQLLEYYDFFRKLKQFLHLK